MSTKARGNHPSLPSLVRPCHHSPSTPVTGSAVLNIATISPGARASSTGSCVANGCTARANWSLEGSMAAPGVGGGGKRDERWRMSRCIKYGSPTTARRNTMMGFLAGLGAEPFGGGGPPGFERKRLNSERIVSRSPRNHPRSHPTRPNTPSTRPRACRSWLNCSATPSMAKKEECVAMKVESNICAKPVKVCTIDWMRAKVCEVEDWTCETRDGLFGSSGFMPIPPYMPPIPP